MPRAYSADIRGRVIARVESGASRREAAEHFEISASTAIKMGKVLSRHGGVREAALREHVAVGGARGLSAHADRGPAALDAG
jgi:transposase